MNLTACPRCGKGIQLWNELWCINHGSYEVAPREPDERDLVPHAGFGGNRRLGRPPGRSSEPGYDAERRRAYRERTRGVA